jgi:hypothetical protein
MRDETLSPQGELKLGTQLDSDGRTLRNQPDRTASSLTRTAGPGGGTWGGTDKTPQGELHDQGRS